LAECHRRDSGKSYGAVYGRMRWDDVGPTITTLCNGYGNGRFGHPEQDRALSLREAAILQTFPQDYEFVNPAHNFYLKDVARQIGNAVPVRLGEVVAKSIINHLGAANER
jgi:DNA (cytosine-5)-methyltransferase 1